MGKHTLEYAREIFSSLKLDLLEDKYINYDTAMTYRCHCGHLSSARLEIISKEAKENKEHLCRSCVKTKDLLADEIDFFKTISNKISKITDWHKVRTCDMPRRVRDKYKHISHFVKFYLSDFEWNEWEFLAVSKNYWDCKINVTCYMNWLGKILGYQKMSDWYLLTTDILSNNKGHSLRKKYGIINLLKISFPDFDWKIEEFEHLSKNQKNLYKIVKKRWTDVKFNYKHPYMKFKKSNYRMELDIFSPSNLIAIEYQGKQHYESVDFFGGINGLISSQNRDEEKRLACKDNDICLIEIPYTWDSREESLWKMINARLVLLGKPCTISENT